MDREQRDTLQAMVEKDVRFDCPMDQYTTFRAGGRAEALCAVSNLEALCRVLAYLHGEGIPWLVIGKGSNLLVRDEGFGGVVIALQGELATLQEDVEDPCTLKVGAGQAIGDLLRYCSRKGLGGLEFLAGIPGTVGGALAMNAGAWGKEIGPLVQEIRIVTGRGRIRDLGASQLRFSYRDLDLPRGSVIVRAGIRLRRESPARVAQKVADYLKERKARQPLEYPSGGSVFRNPPHDHAGRLLEAAGLKGESIGGAMISPKHANFIVNTGGATAGDILRLMGLARERVLEQTGIALEPEIRIAGGTLEEGGEGT